MRPWVSHSNSGSSPRSGVIKRALAMTLATTFALVTLSIIALGIWLFRLDQDIKRRFAEKRFAPPVEFYSAPEDVRAGTVMPNGYFETFFTRKNFRRREFGQRLNEGDYSVWSGEQCRTVVAFDPQPEVSRCIAFRNSRAHDVQIIALDAGDRVLDVFAGPQPQRTESVQIEPELFAQYYGDQPILRHVVPLGQAPLNCLNALLAIEDSQFLEHGGISVTGLFRAALSNLRSGWGTQGGSTITQQLVKNYFLTEEKTLKRKFTEIAMAMLVEKHATKDEILETYINLIYMGQNGPFQVRGFAAASEHYFGKPLNDLNLEQCALLAAVLNSPGLFNPFKHPERALKRRALVLDRMQELKMLDPEQAAQAKAAPLPTQPQRSLTEPAPYFVQAARRFLREKGLDESEGLRVYTSLNLRAQEAAQQAVRTGLEKLEKSYPHIQKLKAQGKNLEAVLVAVDPARGSIQALVGGRGYLATQFNRAIDSRRQVGSVMKPFVYLTALESLTEEGKPYTPLTLLKDTATTHKFEGQTWTPRNYDGSYLGEVPLFFALKESLNASTANLGMSVGISNIVDVSRRMGVRSKIAPLPSLTLGAFELSPMEVVEAYGTLARLGNRVPLTFVTRVESLAGEERFVYEPKPEQVVAPETVAELVGIMKQTLISGTGRGARLAGFLHPAAGKTGTTNDKKDAWFAGFTPHHAAIVWVGYDDNTSHKLTGASGAVPLWTNYMKSYGATFPADDFPWPEGVELATLSPEQQMSLGVPQKSDEVPEPVELVFKRGQAPPTPPPAFDPAAPPTPNPFKPPGI